MKKLIKYLIYLNFRAKEYFKAVKYKHAKVNSPESLINLHFRTWSDPQHINKIAFLKIINTLNGKPARIIETGTSAWGTDSTRLWDKYIQQYGGEFISIDIREEPAKRLRKHMHSGTTLLIEDSVSALKQIKSVFDVYFFDSYDLDLNDPEPSANHGYLEYLQIKNKLKINDIIFIDDTPSRINALSIAGKAFLETNKVMPGKGAFVIPDLYNSFKIEVLHHEYSFIALIKGLTP